MKDQDYMRSAIAGAIGALRRGDEDYALVLFGRLAGSAGLPVRQGVLELADANVTMLRSLTGHQPNDDLIFTIDDDGPTDAGSIDDADPAQRSTARILLALANGYPDDADLHLDIVAAAPDRNATGQVFAYMMGWTLELLDLCEDSGHSVPGWLRPVLARH
ncbi:MAG TPA: hypothetical protein VEO01_39210 [Pseudonocardiaceae bacterium]|nr:hypothetical protein [Pseudonocardiaceae bacterium]